MHQAGAPARFAALLAQTRVYAVTDDSLAPDQLLLIADELLAAGLRLFQFRDKGRSDRERVEIAEALIARVRPRGGLVIINDRADLAIASGADGAHLGQDDLPLGIARELLGPELILGASASYLPEIPEAIAAGIDYLGFGAVYATDTKPDAELAGLDLFAQACERVSLPIVGIGGISIERAAAVIERGASGVAVVSALFRAPDPQAAARGLLAAVGGVPGA